MLKKSLFVGGALLLLMGLFFGRDAFSYVSTTVGQVKDRVKSNVPVEFEIERVRNMITGLEPEIRQNMQRIAREEVEVAKLERELNKRRDELASDQRDIMRLRDDLESGQSHFVYVGRSYTADQVRTDLENRFAHFRTAKSLVDQKDQILQARYARMDAARQKLEEMLAAKRQLEVEVEQLEARQKMVEVAQTASEINFDDSRLARTRELIDDINARLEVSEKLLGSKIQLHDRIPLEEPETKEDVLDAITDYFGSQSNVETVAERVH